jgi:hypothetical protein
LVTTIKIVEACVVPDGLLRGLIQPDEINMGGSRIEIEQLGDETGRKVVVEDRLHT